MAVEKRSFDYMRSVNPIAQRIAEEIDLIRETHKDWDRLDLKKRDQLLDEKLIDPNLVDKYEEDDDMQSGLTFSSNFSWFSKSQLNLYTHIKVKNDNNKFKTPPKKTDVLSPFKRTSKAVNESIKQTENTSIFSKFKNKVVKEDKQIVQKNVAKPKTPPPPPPSKLVPVEEKGLLDESLDDNIPKTGFDFLDNW